MKSLNLKVSHKKPNLSLNTIEVDNQNIKFKNEIFQKLFDNNNTYRTSKERINSHGNLHFKKKHKFYSPEINKHSLNVKYKNRNPSNIFNNSKSRKGLKISNSKRGNNTFSNTNSKSTKIIKSNKILRTKNNNNSNKKLKNYPNLIKGVLNQVKYYNLNKNTNYNDNTRYKPVDDFFNEQVQSPIYIGSINDNNTNSPNNSFNLDFKQEQKENNQTNSNDINDNNNIRKIKINDDDNNNEYLEKEVKPRKMIYRKKNVGDKKIKNIKSISPIKTKNIEKTDSDIINEDICISNNNIDNYDNNNKNRNNNNDDNNKDNINIIYLKNKKKNEYIPPETINIKFDPTDNRENTIPLTIEEIKPKIELILENNNYFSIYNNNKNNIFENLELCPNYNLSFINFNKKENSYNNLELINCDMINYIGKKLKNKINKGPHYDNNGNLIFSNDDEALKYIKKKIIEEKDMIYKNNKIKYNYFILSKQFHGKLLYEIGLENNLNKINEILEKENVEIEHEPIMFIFKKDFNKIKNNEFYTDKINENNNNKFSEEIKKLNEINKEKEEQLNEMENILNEYQIKLKEYIKVNNILQNEKEKYIKYINELQEYNEKIINEYQNIKSQLELEMQKNSKNENNNKDSHANHFNNDLLNIITADFFNILSNNDNYKDKDNQTQSNNYSNYLKDNIYQINGHSNDNQDDKFINNNIEIISDNDNNYIYRQKINDNETENTDKNNEKNESLNRALQRIKNMKENQEKNNEDEIEIKKSDKIAEIAQNLEKKLMKNTEYKEYDDEKKIENNYYQSDDDS